MRQVFGATPSYARREREKNDVQEGATVQQRGNVLPG